MDTGKKCYKCFTAVDADEGTCPRCGAKLGPAQISGLAKKPSSPAIPLIMAAIALGIVLKAAVLSRPDTVSAGEQAAAVVMEGPEDTAVRAMKQKASDSLSAMGIMDIRRSGETLCLYVDQRFTGLSDDQRQRLLSILAGEWARTLGREKAPLKILDSASEKILEELVL